MDDPFAIPEDVNEKLMANTGFRVATDTDDEGTYFILVDAHTGEQYGSEGFDSWGDAVMEATVHVTHFLREEGYVFRDGRWVEGADDV